MMLRSKHRTVGTYETLLNSIDKDERIYRWFKFLINQPAIKSKFAKEGVGRDLYRNMEQSVVSRWVMAFCGLTLSISSIYFHDHAYLWLNVFFIFPIAKLYRDRKRWVKEISTQILVHDFEPSELRRKALTQISSLCLKKYNIATPTVPLLAGSDLN